MQNEAGQLVEWVKRNVPISSKLPRNGCLMGALRFTHTTHSKFVEGSASLPRHAIKY